MRRLEFFNIERAHDGFRQNLAAAIVHRALMVRDAEKTGFWTQIWIFSGVGEMSQFNYAYLSGTGIRKSEEDPNPT